MLNSFLRFSCLISQALLPIAIYAQCNGHLELCNKRFDEVAYVTTHNAYNAGENGFALPNHNLGITQQLSDGVRGLMLDVYDEGGVATVYHGFAFLGTEPLESNLNEIKSFLDANPTEVVTIIFECYVDSGMIEEAFTNVGLIPYLHSQTHGEPWPTLQEMISSGKRLVVLSDRNDAGAEQPWYHYVWDFAVETGFSNNAPGDFSCDFNRGDSINDLFILNHFVTDANIGIGIQAQAEIVNAFDFFYPRATHCWEEQQKFPNFLTIDFHEFGDAFEVADSLNGIPSSLSVQSPENQKWSVYPNPSDGMFIIDLGLDFKNASYMIFKPDGSLVAEGIFKESQKSIDLQNVADGVYHFVVLNDSFSTIKKLVKLSE